MREVAKRVGLVRGLDTLMGLVMSYAIGVVGATGQVGREFLRILEEGERPDLPDRQLRLFASERSAGKRITVRGQELWSSARVPEPRLFEGLDFVLTRHRRHRGAHVFSPPSPRPGALNVDKSNAWRMDPTVPLVVPEVNPAAARGHHGIIAGPNCSTTQMVVALWPIHQVNPIERIVVDTYQAVSGTGWRAVDELQAQAERARAARPAREVYPHQIHLNLIPEIGGYKGDGLYSEERKMIDETRKIFDAPGPGDQRHLRPRAGGGRPLRSDPRRARAADAPGRGARGAARGAGRRGRRRSAHIRVPDAAGRRRARTPSMSAAFAQDPSHPRGLALWVVGDNLRKGAALNAIQVFELVARNGWQTPAAARRRCTHDRSSDVCLRRW